MIDKASAIPTALSRLKKLEPGRAVTLLTFKKDRWITIRKNDDDTYAVTERGFENRETQSDFKSLKKTLKVLLKREFPRSNKVHLRLD